MSGHVGEGKWNSLALTTQLLPETAKPRAREPFSAVTPPMGGGDGWCSGKGNM